jgi:hypothetical protein
MHAISKRRKLGAAGRSRLTSTALRNGYGNYKCRCEACTTAWAEVTLERRHRREAKAEDAT